MTYRLRGIAIGVGIFVATACGGDAFSTKSGDGDGDTTGDGDGDGPTPGDGDGPQINFGIEGLCETDRDCIAVAVTSDACYSRDCSSPYAASYDDIEEDPCLVPWVDGMAPEATEECRFQSDEPHACDLSCAQPPLCMDALCDDGVCTLDLGYQEDECEPDGGGTGGGANADCDDLDNARAEALADARVCILDGIILECTTPEWVSDECGCPIAVNDARSGDVAAAREAYDDWSAACEPPMKCQLIDCQAAGDSSKCVSDGAGGGVCEFSD